MKDSITQSLWYAMRVTYGREMKLKDFLDKENISNFIPMQYKQEERKGQIIKKLVPVVRNLIFVKSNRETLDSIKEELKYQIPSRYIMDKASNKPIVVPEREMLNFIAVAGTQSEQLLYLENIASHLGKGDRVRITGGIFSGVEGEVFRIKRDKRVIVMIKGVIAVATAFIHSTLLQKI